MVVVCNDERSASLSGNDIRIRQLITCSGIEDLRPAFGRAGDPVWHASTKLLHRSSHDYFRPSTRQAMAHSLSEECTPPKRQYDSCFNAWFEGYLEPAVAATPAERLQYSQQKAEEYESKCGQMWSQYKACVQVRYCYLACNLGLTKDGLAAGCQRKEPRYPVGTGQSRKPPERPAYADGSRSTPQFITFAFPSLVLTVHIPRSWSVLRIS